MEGPSGNFYTCIGVDMLSNRDLLFVLGFVLVIGTCGTTFFFFRHAQKNYETLQLTVEKLQAQQTEMHSSSTDSGAVVEKVADKVPAVVGAVV